MIESTIKTSQKPNMKKKQP
jgi:hypothetical protein